MKKPLPRWLRPRPFHDGLFALYDRACRAARGALDFLVAAPRPAPRRRAFRPAVEGLEVREVLSTFGFAPVSYTAAQAAGSVTATVQRTDAT